MGETKEMTDENSGHYVIASSRPPERRMLERRTLVPKLASFPRALSVSAKIVVN